MKKTIIITVLMLSAASLTFGQNFYGRQGGNSNAPAYQNFKNSPGGGAVVEIVELKGKITVNENECPSIKSGKEDLDILISPQAVETLNLKSGDTVEVKGIKVPGPNWSVDEKSALKVMEITVNGKTYLVRGGRGDMGRRGQGMMDGRRDSSSYGRGNSFKSNTPGSWRE